MSRIMWGVETDPETIAREKLLEIVRPSAEDLRIIGGVRANTEPPRKLAPEPPPQLEIEGR